MQALIDDSLRVQTHARPSRPVQVQEILGAVTVCIDRALNRIRDAVAVGIGGGGWWGVETTINIIWQSISIVIAKFAFFGIQETVVVRVVIQVVGAPVLVRIVGRAALALRAATLDAIQYCVACFNVCSYQCMLGISICGHVDQILDLDEDFDGQRRERGERGAGGERKGV